MSGKITIPMLESSVNLIPPIADASGVLTFHHLTLGQESEVLGFLEQRPLHTVVMAGHIRDNGLENSLNRGTFYGARNAAGLLEGVALIGHATLMETCSDAALVLFARLARTRPEAHLIMGEQDKIERFWKSYAGIAQEPRRVCRELLFEQRHPATTAGPVSDLRLATLADLEAVMVIQGEMAFAESGINPLELDFDGFRTRCARRIQQKRVWVLVDDGRLVFKVDVMAATPQVFYLEGIHVHPQERSRGLGARCMAQLSQILLTHTSSLSILVNEESHRARSFFERIGFQLHASYDTIFLEHRGGPNGLAQQSRDGIMNWEDEIQ